MNIKFLLVPQLLSLRINEPRVSCSSIGSIRDTVGRAPGEWGTDSRTNSDLEASLAPWACKCSESQNSASDVRNLFVKGDWLYSTKPFLAYGVCTDFQSQDSAVFQKQIHEILLGILWICSKYCDYLVFICRFSKLAQIRFWRKCTFSKELFLLLVFICIGC